MKQLEYEGAFDTGLFSDMYRNYSSAVTRYLRHVVRDPDLAEDLMQEVFMKLFEKNLRLEPDSPRTMKYLFATARNIAIDQMRRKRVELDRIRSMQFREAELDRRFYEDIGNAQLRGEIISTLRDVINSFPEEHRTLLVRKNLENRDAKSVAREGGTSAYLFRKIDAEFNRRIRESLGHYFTGSE